MKKVLILLLLWPALAQAQDPRLMYGGYSPQQLYNAETSTYRGMDMYFEGTLLEYPVVIQYSFEYNTALNAHGMTQAAFFPMTQYDDTTRYYQESLKIAEFYNQYHGQPDVKTEQSLTWQEQQADIRLMYNLPSWQLWYLYHNGGEE